MTGNARIENAPLSIESVRISNHALKEMIAGKIEAKYSNQVR